MVINEKKFKDYVHYYDFYGAPDGEECLPKTYYYTKYATIGGAVFSVYETALFSKPTTFHSIIGRFGRFTLPFAGMGFVFGSSLCILGQVRKKNDSVNHGLAGMLAGTVWGFKYGSVRVGHAMALLVGFTAAYFKFFNVNNIEFFKIRPECYATADPRLDWTIKMYDDPGRPDHA